MDSKYRGVVGNYCLLIDGHNKIFFRIFPNGTVGFMVSVEAHSVKSDVRLEEMPTRLLSALVTDMRRYVYGPEMFGDMALYGLYELEDCIKIIEEEVGERILLCE